MPKLQIPEKLLPLLQKPKRFKITFGGRGGAKSQTIADILLYNSATSAAKVGCFREYQNSIDDSVYSLLEAEIARLELTGFSCIKNQINHTFGGVFKFKGLARNPESVQSMHGFTHFWIEEAQTTSDDSLRILTPTLRTGGSEIWCSLNPMSSSDPISKRFLEPYMDKLLKDGYYEDDLHLVIWINYMDNPWFPPDLEQERISDYERLPRNLYNHIWLGHYNDSVDNSVIPVEWFEAAINLHERLGFKARGAKVLAHDPADLGEDKKAYALRHGSVVLDVVETSIGDVNEACDWALDKAIEEQVDIFTWDCDGMGISLKRQIEQSLSGKHIQWEIFKGSESPDNPKDVYEDPYGRTDRKKQRINREVFKNKRAQYYWKLRDRFYASYQAASGKYVDPDMLISLSPDIVKLNQLRAEVCRVPRKFNGNGLIQILSKPEMKRLKIKSPNMADALMMSMLSPSLVGKPVDMEFKSLW